MRFSEKQQLIILIVVFSLILVGEGVFGYLCLNDRKEAKALIATLDQQRRDAEQKIRLIPSLTEKSEDLAKIIGEYVEILPSDEDVGSDAFLEDIDRFTRDTGLEIKSAKPVVLKRVATSGRKKGKKGGGARQARNFVRHKYRFELEGTFFGLVKFITAIENHSRFLQVDTLEVRPLKVEANSGSKMSDVDLAENPRKHLMVEISTYTYSKETVAHEEAK